LTLVTNNQHKFIRVNRLNIENWAKQQIDSGRHGNDSEYFRDLIRRDQERLDAENRLRSILDETEASG
jgi:antitoxin ParD1/3/4